MPRKSGIRLDEDGFGALVGSIYDAAIDPSGWHSVLDNLRQTTQSTCANLLGVHREGGDAALLADVNIDPRCSAEYQTHYASVCPRLRYGQKFPNEGIYYDEQLGGDKFIDSADQSALRAAYEVRPEKKSQFLPARHGPPIRSAVKR